MSNERTYHTRLALTKDQEILFSEYAGLYGKVERKLFAAGRGGEGFDKLKVCFMREYRVTARQFNAISRNLKGKISSIAELQNLNIKNLEGRIETAIKKIAKIRNRNKRHQKLRRLVILNQKLAVQQKNKAENKINLCFGSRKLFNKQFHLQANGYTQHEEWLADWRKARNSQFYVIGSKDETGGCQGCVATMEPNGSLTLRLRLPDAFCSGTPKHTIIRNIRFAYGHNHIARALAAKQSLSYRFVRDSNGWRVFVTTDMPYIEEVSRRQLGAIGLDVNEGCLAVTEIDHYGNLVASKVIPCVTYGKTSEQALAVIGDACRAVIAGAKTVGKPIVIEKIDFSKKKAVLENNNARHSRMLSSLSYSAIKRIITARAYDAGIEVISVNPAYTSTIGQLNFAGRFGISIHQGAAMAIARRGLGFTEKPATAEVILPDGVHVTLALPVRNRAKHVWTQWAGIRRNLRAAHAAHRQLLKHTPSRPETPPLGAICLLPVKPRHASQQNCSAGDNDVPLFVEHLSMF
jgi:IS605 OrfB family transposase